MKYQLLTADTPQELEAMVNALLADGWQLYGDHSVTPIYCKRIYSGGTESVSYEPVYAQAMTKEGA